MQDQKAEGQQEHQLAAGEATTRTPPSTPSLECKHDYAYYKSVFGSHPMPFAFLDLDLLQQNISQIVAQAQGKKVACL